MLGTLAQKLREIDTRASGMGFSHEAWSAIGISSDHLERVRGGDLTGWTVSMAAAAARLIGLDDVVLWDEAPLPPSSTRHFDGSTHIVPPHDQAVAQAALSLAQAIRTLGGPPPAIGCAIKWPKRQLPNTRARIYEQGYRLARALRKQLGNTNQPIPFMVSMVEDQVGIPVVSAPLSSDLQGITVAGGGAVVIVLAERLWSQPTALRRTLAHELCHALHDPLDGDGTFAAFDGDLSDDTGSQSEDTTERRARAFQAELLVPLAALSGQQRADIDTTKLITDVSNRFGAPPRLVSFHLQNHGVLAQDPSRELPRSVNFPEEPRGTLIQRRLHAAVDDDRISSGRARELLSLLPA